LILWGRDLSIILDKVYGQESRYCLIILSTDYLQKPWTNQERRSAISTFIKNRSDYILCLKVEDVDLPGYASVMGYVSLDRMGEDSVYKLLLQKLGHPNHEMQLTRLSPDDVNLAREVIVACLRRAIYTRMDSEIRLSAMYDSIGKSLGRLQEIIPMIHDQSLQFACLEIINALDGIERTRMLSNSDISVSLPTNIRRWIDDAKLKVVRLLLEIRRAANIPMQLPFALRTDHFFGSDEADQTPAVGIT
jgi:hypothetical protein